MAPESLQLKLFRRAATDAASQRGLGKVPSIAAPRLAAASGAALGIVVLLGMAVTLIEIPERIVARGVMLSATLPVEVRSSRFGVVDALHVRDGDRVHQGQPLLRIAERTAAAGRLSPQTAQRQSLARELELLQTVGRREHDEQRLQLAANDAQLGGGRRRIVLARREIATLRRVVTLEGRRLARVEQLVPRATIAAQIVDERRVAALAARQRLYAAEQRLATLEMTIASLEAERELTAVRDAVRVAQRRMHAEALGRELLALDAAAADSVSAPIDGVISALRVSEGSPATPGRTLLTIVDPDAQLDAHLYISDRDGGRVAPGQRVEIQVLAFPRDRFGTIAARVVGISAAPLPAPDSIRTHGQTGNVYRVQTQLEMPASADGFLDEVPVGAPLRADIVRERRPLYRWLLQALEPTG